MRPEEHACGVRVRSTPVDMRTSRSRLLALIVEQTYGSAISSRPALSPYSSNAQREPDQDLVYWQRNGFVLVDKAFSKATIGSIFPRHIEGEDGDDPRRAARGIHSKSFDLWRQGHREC